MQHRTTPPARWAPAAIAVLGLAALSAQAGPNLIAIGSFEDVPFVRATGRDALGGREIIFTISDPEYDFGRVIVRPDNIPNSVVRRDLFVGFSRGALIIDKRTLQSGQIKDFEIWLRVKGNIRPSRTYEWEAELVAENDKVEGGIPAIIPLMWADGQPVAHETKVVNPEVDPNEGISRLNVPHGAVQVRHFERQTGAAWIVLRPDQQVGNIFGVRRFSFREVGEDIAEQATTKMPVPVRYIPIGNRLEQSVAEALSRGGDFLRQFQDPNVFAWNAGNLEDSVYFTALCAGAIAGTGSNPGEGDLARALDWLADQVPAENTRWEVPTVAARLFCLSRYGGLDRYSKAINSDVNFLTYAQYEDGGWSRLSRSEDKEATQLLKPDNQHSAMAVWALSEAHFAGVRTDRAMWRKAAQYWIEAQAYDGGYRNKSDKYGGIGEATTTARTAEGAASLFMTLDMAYGIGSRSCRDYLANRRHLHAIRSAEDWLDKFFMEQFRNVGSFVAGGADPYAEPDALLSLWALSGRPYYNEKNSFNEALEMLMTHHYGQGMFGVAQQQGPSPQRTAMAMNMLAGPSSPIALQRLIIGLGEEGYEQFNRDATHMARYLTSVRRRNHNWREASIEWGVSELRQAPLTLISVVGASKWTEAEWQKIRSYCLAGGTVLLDFAEDQTGQRDAVLAAMKAAFPEYELKPVPEDDRIYKQPTEIKPVEGLLALDNGFRKFLFVPNQSWSCLWHQYQVEANPDAFRFLSNLVQYMTDGTPLRAAFASSTYPVESACTLELGFDHLEVGGDVPAYPSLGELVDLLMQSNFRVKVNKNSSPDMLWVSVTGAKEPGEAAKKKILEAMRGETFILFDVVSGNKEWEESFRAALRSMDKDITIVKLRGASPLYTGEIAGSQGFDVRRVPLRKALHTRLETYGVLDLHEVRYKGTPVGVYSTYDIASGVGYHFFEGCRGPVPRTARQFAMNAALNAMRLKAYGREE